MNIPVIPINPKNKLEEKIAEIALMFDFTATKSIECKDLGNIVRFLGCAATETDLKDICIATEFDKELSGCISIAKLMQHIVELLIQQKMKPSNTEELFKAFQILDPDNTGCIDPIYFRELMLTEGEPLTENEIKEMMREAIDPETGLIAYEFYLNKLMHKDVTIYHMAEEIHKEREAIKAAQASKRNIYKRT